MSFRVHRVLASVAPLRPKRAVVGRLLAIAAVGAALFSLSSIAARAVDVSDKAGLISAINAANGGGGDGTINITATIDLSANPTGPLPPLSIPGTLSINLGGHTITGQGQNRIFFANSGTISISNGTLADGFAKGGNGGSAPVTAGGGGMGAGGALFVQAGAAVTIDNVSFANNSAIGGNGGTSTGGIAAAAGGGGMGGDGGGGRQNTISVGYGGGGAFAGENGHPNSGVSGGDGGGALAGAGGATAGSPGGAGGEFSGGGGAGAYSNPANGGNGGFGGGGGGGTGNSGLNTKGGDGGYGGGGGGAIYGRGGNGGFGGGAGLGLGSTGGGGTIGSPGQAGYGGGAASNSTNVGAGAGGGAGFGGAVFVREGGSLTIAGSGTISGGTVQGGSAGTGATVGLAAGSGFFLQNSGVTFSPAAGETQTVSDTIADSTGNAGDAGAVTKTGDGTLVLSGANTYSGGTTLTDGTLRVENNSALGTGNLDVTGASTLDYAPGVSIGNAIDLGANLTANVDSGSATQSGVISGSSALSKTGEGALVLSGANTYSGGTSIAGGILEAAHATTGMIDALGTGGVSISTGTLRTSVDGSLANNLGITANSTATIAAVDGTTATLTGQISVGNNSVLHFGSATDEGTIIVSFDAANGISTGGAVVVDGGTLKAGNTSLIGLASTVKSTTVAAGAVLDLDDKVGSSPSSRIRNLQGAGDVVIGTLASTLRIQAGDFSGVISGAGHLLTGSAAADVLILSGTNTYQGNTTIDTGTLQLGAGGTTGSIASTRVFNDGALVFDRSNTYDFDAVISGSGAVEQNGTGITVLSAINTYNGSTTVNAGILDVVGSIASSATTVKSGAGLRGAGILGDVTVESGGIHAPGTLGAFQTVGGDYTLAAGAQLDIAVNGAGESSGLIVKGSMDITNAILNVIAAPGTYAYATSYLIIDNQGSSAVGGQFQTPPLLNFAFLDPTLNYAARDGNDVELTLVRNNVSFADVANTRNQTAVAGAIEPPGGPTLLISAIVPLSAGEARQAFDALSGEVFASVAGVLLNDSRFAREAILSRLQQASYGNASGNQLAALAGDGPTTVAGLSDVPMMGLGMGGRKDDAPAAPRVAPLAFWTQGFGSWGDFDGDGNAASADRTLGGFLSGVDAGLGGGWRTGAAVGYTQTSLSVDARLSSASIDSYHVAAYAGGPVGALALRAGGVWSWNDIHTDRTIVFPGFLDRARASYDGDVGQLFGELALPVSLSGAALEPFAGLAYVHVGSSGFGEGGGLAALNGSGSDQDTGYSTLGLRLATRTWIGGIETTPRASLAWQHAFGDVDTEAALAFSGGGSSFAVSGVPLARDSALVEAGLDLRIAPDATVGISYTGQLGSNIEDHGLSGRLAWHF